MAKIFDFGVQGVEYYDDAFIDRVAFILNEYHQACENTLNGQVVSRSATIELFHRLAVAKILEGSKYTPEDYSDVIFVMDYLRDTEAGKYFKTAIPSRFYSVSDTSYTRNEYFNEA